MYWKEWNAWYRQWAEGWHKLLTAGLIPAAASTAPHGLNEARLFSLMCEMSDQVLAVFDGDAHCTYLSSGFNQTRGNGMLTNRGFYDCLHADDTPHFTAALQAAAREGTAQAFYPQHFRLRHANGEWCWYMLQIGAVETASDGGQHIITLFKNVQAALTAETTLREARRQAEMALQARSEFLNAMSHDLRTPLNAILGFTQMMESGIYGDIGNPQYRDYLHHIRESGYELLEQIDDIMSMAHVDSGISEAHAEAVDVYEILGQAAAAHRARMEKAAIAFSCNAVPGQAMLRVDRTKLSHCIGHILANALRFTPEGGRIALETEWNAEGEFVITVTDTGAGMQARKLQTVVAALQNNDGWSAQNAKGLGLGLALAKEFARLHGGYITLESAHAKGTRVSVHLPAERAVRVETAFPRAIAV
ncbi:MAG: PAS domain-containing sensor histidine kinase [Alphaproteobacteria bacterium]|nr:PAS domain-containing sensor histidine kinase [Alphaproteobacteria bacterium]